MKLPTDKSPSALYAAWWKAVGDRQEREVPGPFIYRAHPDHTYEQLLKLRQIERAEFISLIKQLLLWHSAQ